MMANTDTRNITNYLKGIAIVSVLVLHYAVLYSTNNVQLVNYGTSLISLFFILSGYGLFLSFEKKYPKGEFGKGLLKYAFDRFLRIIPLYWLSLIIAPFFLAQFQKVFSLSPEPLIYFFGIPLVAPPMQYWFVTGIIQCYLVAPFIYMAIKRYSLKKIFIALTAASVFLYLISVMWFAGYVSLPLVGSPGSAALGFEDYASLPFNDYLHLFLTKVLIRSYSYKNFFFANIVLFTLGMLIPSIITRLRNRFDNPWKLFLSAIPFIAMIQFSKSDILTDKVFIAPLFFASTFMFCLYAIGTKPKMPMQMLLIPLGKHSYSLFLFHFSFFAALGKLGWVTDGSNTGIIITIALLPVFFVICLALEKGTNSLSHRIDFVSISAKNSAAQLQE